MAFLESLSIHSLGIEKYGFVNETECFQNDPAVSDSLCNPSSDSSAKTASRLLKTNIAGGDDLATRKLAGKKTFCYESSTFIDDSTLSTPNTLSKSLSVEYLGLEQYGFIRTPDSLLSLALEKYRFVAEVESFEAETTEKEEEEKQNPASHKRGVGLSNFSSEKSIQAAGDNEDPDECYERFSKSLKVYIPAPHEYNGCDIEAINFLSSYYPTKSQQV